MKNHSTLSHLVALSSIFIGFFLSPLPEETGFFRIVEKLQPALIGMIPFLHRGIPWKYSYEELFHTCSTDEPDSIKGERAVVTGANSGIGYEITKALVQCGAHVTMVCRNLTKCNRAAQQIKDEIQNDTPSSDYQIPDIDTMIADFSSLTSVKSFAITYLKKYNTRPESSIDMLYLNAGYPGRKPQDGPSEFLSEDGIEKVFATNYVGHHLMYRLLEPMLLQSKMARISQTSSAASFETFPHKVATSLAQLNERNHNHASFKYYGQSKLAQIVWTKHLTKRLEQSSIHHVYVNALHPGAVYTPIFSVFMARFPEWVYRIGVVLTARLFWTPKEGALTPLFLGVAKKKIKDENVKGTYYHPQVQQVVNNFSLDEQLQADLWAFSDELVADFL